MLDNKRLLPPLILVLTDKLVSFHSCSINVASIYCTDVLIPKAIHIANSTGCDAEVLKFSSPELGLGLKGGMSRHYGDYDSTAGRRTEQYPMNNRSLVNRLSNDYVDPKALNRYGHKLIFFHIVFRWPPHI